MIHFFRPQKTERREWTIRVGRPALLLTAWMAATCGGTHAQTAPIITKDTRFYEIKNDGIYTNGKRLPTKNIAGTIESVDMASDTITVQPEGKKGTEAIQMRSIGCYLEIKGTRTWVARAEYNWPPRRFGNANLSDIFQGSSIQGNLYQDKPHKDMTWHCLSASITLTPKTEAALAEAEAKEDARKKEMAAQQAAKQREIAEQNAQREAQKRGMIAAWRANGSKLELPEEAQRHKVLAEEAFKEKNLQKAAKEYNAALEIYPTWPSGQYNLALILGELKNFSQAAEHMSTYLELDPNAADAEQMKGQIWIWQDKANVAGLSRKP